VKIADIESLVMLSRAVPHYFYHFWSIIMMVFKMHIFKLKGRAIQFMDIRISILPVQEDGLKIVFVSITHRSGTCCGSATPRQERLTVGKKI
jgi:hypothetical protein